MLISPDELLYQDGDYVWSKDQAAAAWATSYERLQEALRGGQVREVVCLMGLPGSGKSTWLEGASTASEATVYFDATFCKAHHRQDFLGRLTGAPVMKSLVWLDTPLKVCQERNSLRPKSRQVPDSQIESMAVAVRMTPPALTEGWDQIRVVRP